MAPIGEKIESRERGNMARKGGTENSNSSATTRGIYRRGEAHKRRGGVGREKQRVAVDALRWKNAEEEIWRGGS